MAEVRWQPDATEHLREIYEHVQQDSPGAARRLIDDLISATERLRHFPELGRITAQFGHARVRELVVGKYRIAYRNDPGVVSIAAVHHGARDIKTLELIDD